MVWGCYKQPVSDHTVCPSWAMGVTYHFFPHLCVGFFFLILYPAPAPDRRAHSVTHNFVIHHLSHTNLVTHTLFPHTIFHTPSATHNFITHHLYNFVTHHHFVTHPSFTHTTLSHTVYHLFVTHSLSHTRFHTLSQTRE
jgi:hypothetical protein